MTDPLHAPMQPDPLDQIVLGLREVRELLAETRGILDSRTDAALAKLDEVSYRVSVLREETDERPAAG